MRKSFFTWLTKATESGRTQWAFESGGALRARRGKHFVKLVYKIDRSGDGAVSAETTETITSLIGRDKVVDICNSRQESALHKLFREALKSASRQRAKISD
jgi:hypothetical protein